ncbi:MAG: MBL fold metallo-hydrolase, partial [Bacteroidales bacterium]|nr:MBL fold metallo-hydrolase [Bacteroidales bacterium]
MKITFHGATQTVTGSKHLISLTNGKNILLDCGMFQGLGKETVELNNEFGFNPAEVNYLILSHAHIDHCGLIPKLVKEGFRGPIFGTSATLDLSEILLLNSAYIQENDVRFLNKKRFVEGRQPLEPLYTEEHVKQAITQFQKVPYNSPFGVDDDIEIQLYDAGHILGASTVYLRLKENGKTTRIAFSGDVGRYGETILRSPQPFPQADYIIIESTYGDRLHQEADPPEDFLYELIVETCLRKKGKLIIPAFSV